MSRGRRRWPSSTSPGLGFGGSAGHVPLPGGHAPAPGAPAGSPPRRAALSLPQRHTSPPCGCSSLLGLTAMGHQSGLSASTNFRFLSSGSPRCLRSELTISRTMSRVRPCGRGRERGVGPGTAGSRTALPSSTPEPRCPCPVGNGLALACLEVAGLELLGRPLPLEALGNCRHTRQGGGHGLLCSPLRRI